MALKKALTDIADKIRFYTGKTNKLPLSTMPAEIENVYEAGKTEHNRFWESMLENGERTNFATAFAGHGWNDKTFRPLYDMTPSGTVNGSATSMFNTCHITDLAGILSSLGRKIDFSQAKSLKYCFSNSTITHIPRLDVSSAESLEDLARGCTKLISIEEISLSETIVQKLTNSFKTCKALQYLRWSGGSIKTDVDLSAATQLDRASITSTVKALSSFEEEAATETEFYDAPVLIKLSHAPQNIEGYEATIVHTIIDFGYDEETGEQIINSSYEEEETISINDNGEAVFTPIYTGTRVKAVTNANGESVEYSLHLLETDNEPTATFSHAAVNKAFETSEGANDGASSYAWYLLSMSRPMATISLV